MTTLFDEIVFANRNKAYGAYILRTNYVRNVLIGVLISFIITCGFCGYFFYNNFIAVEDYSFSSDVLQFAKYNIDEELLRQTKLDPLKDKIKAIPQPRINTKPVEVVGTQATNATQLREAKLVDSVAVRDSLDKAKQALIEAENEKTRIDSLPKFGGSTDAFRNYLVSQIVYPDTSYIRKMKGKLLITFIINQNGDAENITLDNFAETRWGKAIITAIKSSPRWQPAYRRGKPCKMQYTIPVFFAY